MPIRFRISPAYKLPVLRNGAAQLLVLIAGGGMLDGGFFLAATLIATVAYWFSLGLVVFRRPLSPTKGDLTWVNAGFAVSMALAFTLGPLASVIWHSGPGS